MSSLFQFPPVIEIIFKHLSAPDLSKCAQVCKMWSSMSATELESRKKVTWFFQFSENEDTNFGIQKEVTDVPENSLDPSTIRSGIHKQLTNIEIKPSFTVAFASYAFVENFDELGFESDTHERKRRKCGPFSNKRKYVHKVIKTALHKYLPADSKCIFAVAPGIVGTCSNYTPLEFENGFAISGFCLPEFPGVEVHRFSISVKNYDISDLISEDKHMKCLLVFLTERGTTISNDFIRKCVLREERNLAVGGAIISHSDSLLGSAIAFCGDNIEASSVIIQVGDKSEQIKNKLKIFYETGLLVHQCFAFMFACVARGYAFHRSHNLESSVFHSLYPQVPLVGLFGNGELGINYFPHVSKDSKVYRCGSFPKSHETTKCFFHSHTTIFVLVAIKS